MNNYEYPEVDMDIVLANPEIFIIPECLEACKILWSKNIETRMCSNYSFDTHYWIDFDLISDENKKLFERLCKDDPRYCIDRRIHSHRISSRLQKEEAAQELIELASIFSTQDVHKVNYYTEEQFLNRYKHFSANDQDERNIFTVDEYGRLHTALNPDKANATLEEALLAENMSELYVPEEGRIYKTKRALEWHNHYLESLQINKQKKLSILNCTP